MRSVARRVRQESRTYLPDAFVLDCSVCLAWYFQDEADAFSDGVGRAVHHADVWVPILWRPELISAVTNAYRRKRITDEQRGNILKNAHELPLRIDYQLPGILELDEIATRYELTAYDAVYLELASRRKLPLATLDAALIAAARTAKLPLLTTTSV